MSSMSAVGGSVFDDGNLDLQLGILAAGSLERP